MDFEFLHLSNLDSHIYSDHGLVNGGLFLVKFSANRIRKGHRKHFRHTFQLAGVTRHTSQVLVAPEEASSQVV